jgi:hypothetical protein
VHSTTIRHTLDLDLSLNDIPLHMFQDIFTLLKSKPDLFGCDSTGATIEFCDLFHGESFASEAGFNPDYEFHGRVSSVAIRSVYTPPQLLQSARLTPNIDTVPFGAPLRLRAFWNAADIGVLLECDHQLTRNDSL